MPKYDVVLYYHASITYTVDALDKDAAVYEAKLQDDEAPEETVRQQLIFDREDGDEQGFLLPKEE